MTNTLVTSAIVARESLAILKNMLSFSMNVNRDYEDEFGKAKGNGYAPGQTINIRRPPRYTYRAGRVSVPQGTVETTIPLTLSQGGVDINFTSLERTLSLQDLENKLEAAIAPLANEIDRQGLELAKFATFNTINAAGALPVTQAAALGIVTDANRRLDEMAAPRDRRRALISNPALNGALIQGFAGLFNAQDVLSKQFKSGMMVDSLGLGYGMDQNVSVHTNGAATATNIAGANQVGSAINVVAIAGGTLTRGTVITLPGVFAVNPQSRQSTGVLMNFVVTADALITATVINISPAIVTSGAFQNVTASPTTGAPYIILGAASTAYAANVAFHKDAFTLACVPLWTPSQLGPKVSQRTEDGFTIRVVEFYDGTQDTSTMRIDALFGWAPTYPELSVKAYTLN